MSNKGFTLIEIVVVLAVGAIVSAVIGRAVLSNFTSYSDMSIIQVQTMALNDVNEILNNQIEDAMSVSVRPSNSILNPGEYGIYTDVDGNLLLKHVDSEGNESTGAIYKSDTGAINILELFVNGDGGDSDDQVQFVLTYTDGTEKILSRQLTTQLMNNQVLNIAGYSYSDDEDTYLLRNDNQSNILVFKKAVTSALELSDEQKLAILSYYLGDPSYTPIPDPQVYFYGMLYWNNDHYEIFNNTSIIIYDPDNPVTGENIVYDLADMSDRPNKYPDILNKSGNTYKVILGTVVIWDNKVWERIEPEEGAMETDINNGNVEFKEQGWKLLGDVYDYTDLSSEEVKTISYSEYDSSIDAAGGYEPFDVVFFGDSLYMNVGTADDSHFVEIDNIYNDTLYPRLVVDKDAIMNVNIEEFDSDRTEPYPVNTYVAATDIYGQEAIYKKVVASDSLESPADSSKRIAGGWQLQTNQYDPFSNYLDGNQVLVFGDYNDEIYVIDFEGDLSAATRTLLNQDIYTYITQKDAEGEPTVTYTSPIVKTGYTLSKYEF